MSQSIDDIIAGMEKIGGEIAVVKKEPKQSGKFSTFIVDAVDKAYADRLEAMLRLAVRQRNVAKKEPRHLGHYDDDVLAIETEMLDAELAKLARGES